MRSTDLFLTLFNHESKNFDVLKWPGEGTFEVILGAILVQNTNWKNYTYLEPLVKVFTDNAPYTMTDYGSGTFGWTSVKNPDIWFYTQEQ